MRSAGSRGCASSPSLCNPSRREILLCQPARLRRHSPNANFEVHAIALFGQLGVPLRPGATVLLSMILTGDSQERHSEKQGEQDAQLRLENPIGTCECRIRHHGYLCCDLSRTNSVDPDASRYGRDIAFVAE